MAFYILNPSYEPVAVVEDYKSLIWTDRYNEAGEFELCASINSSFMPYVLEDNYLRNTDSEHLMIIEGIEFPDDETDRTTVIITGRSFESVLDRRTIPSAINVGKDQEVGAFQRHVIGLLDSQFGHQVSLRPSTNEVEEIDIITNYDPRVVELEWSIPIEEEIGVDLYEWMTTYCQAYDLGFKFSYTGGNKISFMLYFGDDRSYNQRDNSWIVFSDALDNLISRRYVFDKKEYKNIAIVRGEDTSSGTKTLVTVGDTDTSGLDRRFLYVDATGYSRTKENGSKYSESEYTSLLTDIGLQELLKYQRLTTLEAEIDLDSIYKYGSDFFLGDMISVDVGLDAANFRIVEVTTSHEAGEISQYCTLQAYDSFGVAIK